MNVLLTGATGYIGKRLLMELASGNNLVYCFVRDKNRFVYPDKYRENITVYEVDFTKKIDKTLEKLDIEAAFYLIHSMSSSIDDFEQLEIKSAQNFTDYISNTNTKQIIYLSGISNTENLSKHLISRSKVEEVLRKGNVPVTVLRAGIVIGSGSASFEIIRDLVEKLPVMITPKWLNTRCQPISIRDALKFLLGVMLNEKTYGNTYDIGGNEILTYKEMLLLYAEVRGLKRIIFTLPVFSPRLSSYWLYFVTATSYKLAVNLVNSMKVEVVCKDNELKKMLNIETISYKTAVELALNKIVLNSVASSWKDALSSVSNYSNHFSEMEVPVHGCFTDKKEMFFSRNEGEVLDNFFSIGGDRGWYYSNWLWRIRGIIDKFFGGVGLRRGRRSSNELNQGDAVDFWRVLLADRNSKRLILFAEMKLPGEAWLEFRIENLNGKSKLIQTAAFRPKGLFGRLYWYAVFPFHYFVFNGMIKGIVKYKN